MKILLLISIATILPSWLWGRQVPGEFMDNGEFVISAYDTPHVPKCIPIDLLPEDLRNGICDADWVSDMFAKAYERAAVNEDPEGGILSIQTTAYGQLDSIVAANNGLSANTIIISGPIDESDFATLRECCIKGNMRTLDLSGASLKDRKVPDYALYDSKQFSAGLLMPIRKLVLPDDVEVIGKAVCPWSALKEVNMPKSLKVIGSTAFGFNNWLDCAIEIPEGVEEIQSQAFTNNMRLSCNLVLPASLKTIGDNAFSYTAIPVLELPGNIETIKAGAFVNVPIKKLEIPESIRNFGEYSFSGCFDLEELKLPDSMQSIPNGAFSNCLSLKEVDIPSNCTRICRYAFGLSGIEKVNFPESMEIIESGAFEECHISLLVLPSKLSKLGAAAFSIYGLRSVYCKAQVPPVCLEGTGIYSGYGPFGSEARIANMELYVPHEAAGTYGSVWQWNQFGKIEEIDSFPSMGVTEDNEGSIDSPVCHDLMGRRITSPATGQMYIENGRKYISPAH